MAMGIDKSGGYDQAVRIDFAGRIERRVGEFCDPASQNSHMFLYQLSVLRIHHRAVVDGEV